MHDFKVSQLFCIPMKSSRIKTTSAILWKALEVDCVKINCDGFSYGQTPSGSIGYVLRNSQFQFLGVLVQNIGLNFVIVC